MKGWDRICEAAAVPGEDAVRRFLAGNAGIVAIEEAPNRGFAYEKMGRRAHEPDPDR